MAGHADDAGLWQCILIMNSESDLPVMVNFVSPQYDLHG